MPIDVFRPGDVDNTNFRGLPKVNPTGLQTEAALYDTVANEMAKVSQTFNAIQARKNELAKREAMARVKIAEEELKNVDPVSGNGVTASMTPAAAASKQVVDAGVQGYTAKMEIDLQGNLARIANENAGNPARMREMMNAFIEKGQANLPPQISSYYKENATREANFYLEKTSRDQLNAGVAEAKNNVDTLINTQHDQLEQFGMPDSPVAQSTLELRSAKYRVALDNAVRAGHLTAGEAELRVLEIQDSMMESAIVGEIQRAPNKLDFALKVAAGKSGTYLDNASPKQRQYALATAQSLASVEDQIEARKERAIAKAKEASFVYYQKQIITDPFGDHSKTLDRMFKTASTVADMERYEKMKGFIDNAEDDLYNKSDRQTMMLFDMRANKGTLRQEDLDDAFANRDPKKRIGQADYRRLTEKLESEREGLTQTLAFKTFVDRLEIEFPAPRKSGLEGFIAAMGGKQPVGVSIPSEDGAALAANEKLQNETLLELQEAIRDGRITSPEQLTVWGEDRLNKIRASRNQGPYNPEIKEPIVQMARDKVFADPALKGLYDAYKTDRVKFLNAVRSGKISAYDANVLNRAFKGEPLGQVNQTLREGR